MLKEGGLSIHTWTLFNDEVVKFYGQIANQKSNTRCKLWCKPCAPAQMGYLILQLPLRLRPA